jgi:outer membrane receptor protein involved in Fe transport
VNTLTKQPLAAARREFGLTFGSFGCARSTIDLTGPVNRSGTVRYRLNAAYDRGDSYRDLVNHENTFVAPHLVWQPTPRTTVGVEVRRAATRTISIAVTRSRRSSSPSPSAGTTASRGRALRIAKSTRCCRCVGARALLTRRAPITADIRRLGTGWRPFESRVWTREASARLRPVGRPITLDVWSIESYGARHDDVVIAASSRPDGPEATLGVHGQASLPLS